jgi:hypothetical protein
MDFECLGRRHRLEGGLRRRSGAFPLSRRARRIQEKGNIMGYVSFTVIVAAGGALIFWLWYRGYTADDRARKARGNGLPQEPVPPFKRTISGPSEQESAQVQLQERLNAWETAFQQRRTLHNGQAQPIEGVKYNFVPRKRNGEPISNSA